MKPGFKLLELPPSVMTTCPLMRCLAPSFFFLGDWKRLERGPGGALSCAGFSKPKGQKMRIPIILILALLNFLPPSFAEEVKRLDADKFRAPGSSKSDLKAPEKPDIAGRVSDPAARDGNSGVPYRGAVSPVNGLCPPNYDCVSTNNGATLRCRPQGTTQGIFNCTRITQYCAELIEAIPKYPEDREHFESEQNKYCR